MPQLRRIQAGLGRSSQARSRALALALTFTLLALVGALGSAVVAAQEAPLLQLVAVEHGAEGAVTVTIAGPSASQLDAADLSASIEGVASELVVRSGHSAQSHPDTIEEVRRLLLEHAGLTEVAGGSDVEPETEERDRPSGRRSDHRPHDPEPNRGIEKPGRRSQRQPQLVGVGPSEDTRKMIA